MPLQVGQDRGQMQFYSQDSLIEADNEVRPIERSEYEGYVEANAERGKVPAPAGDGGAPFRDGKAALGLQLHFVEGERKGGRSLLRWIASAEGVVCPDILVLQLQPDCVHTGGKGADIEGPRPVFGQAVCKLPRKCYQSK